MGRKNSSVNVDSERILHLMRENGLKKASLAKMIGYSRESVTRSINSERMDIGMLDAIAKALDRDPEYLQGTLNWEASYSDYVGVTKMNDGIECFKRFLQLSEDALRVTEDDLPEEYKNIVPNYGFTEFIEDLANTTYKGEDSVFIYDDLAYNVIDLIRKWVVERYLESLKRNDTEERK